jgi:hypothetical protein
MYCGRFAMTFEKLKSERLLFPKADAIIMAKLQFSGSAFDRGCVKTQNRPLEIVSKPSESSVAVS